MSTQYILDGTPDSFKELVIGNSMRGPVLVNYWSASAGPCMMLWPRLEALANEFNGQFLLINFNTDKYKSFVQNELGIRSVPTLQIYFNQQVVDVVHGAESEHSIRERLIRHLPRSSDSLLVESVKLYNNNQVDKAIEELKNIQKIDPENPRVATSVIKLLFRESRFDEMHEYIKTQSSAVKNNEEIISLQTHASLQQEAASVEDINQLEVILEAEPENVIHLYRFAAVKAINDQLTDALETLLKILKIEPEYRDRLPARTMVLLINAMGSHTEEARNYRARMLDALGANV